LAGCDCLRPGAIDFMSQWRLAAAAIRLEETVPA
jgi:hypothetical protein